MALSQDDLDYIDSMFDMMDINKDGSISIRELTKCKDKSRSISRNNHSILAMAAQGNKPRNQEIQKMFQEADVDGKHTILAIKFLHR